MSYIMSSNYRWGKRATTIIYKSNIRIKAVNIEKEYEEYKYDWISIY